MGTKFLSRIALVMVLILTLGMTYSLNAEAASETYYYALNRVNVRAKPDVNSKSLGVLSENDIVCGTKTVSDSTGKKWVYAYTQFGNGYISKNSLTKCHDYDGHQTSHQSSSKTLVVAKTIKVTSLSGNTGTLKKGTKVKATRFYPTRDGLVVQISIGKNDCRISGKYLRQTNGKKIPSLPRKVRLKKAYDLNGEHLSKGQTVTVEFYFLRGDKLYADVHEGIIPCSVLKR